MVQLTAELGFMPAITDGAAIERHRRHNKKADYWLARSHRFDHLRREHEPSETAAESRSRLSPSPLDWPLTYTSPYPFGASVTTASDMRAHDVADTLFERHRDDGL